MSSTVEPYADSWLEIERQLGARPLISGTISEIKDQFAAMVDMIASQVPPPDHSTITRETTASHVPVRIYTPAASSTAKLPLGVYFHAGGYAVGNLDSDDSLCRYVSKSIPCILVAVDYRLAPEFKHPTMLEDSLTAFNWAYENLDSLGANPDQVFTIGTSAGGGLALSVANALLKANQASRIHGIIALAPVTAHPLSLPSAYAPYYTAYSENGSDVPFLDVAALNTYFAASGADPYDEGVFVTLSQNLGEFPKTYIVTCGKDPLRDDGTVLRRMLEERGVKVRSDYYAGLPHCFWMMPGIRDTEEFGEKLTEGARWVLK